MYVGIPIFNEEANLSALLDMLLGEEAITSVFAVDDGSTDRSREIIQDYSARDHRVVALDTSGRAGQLAGWICAARNAGSGTIVFIDADALPDPGAVRELARAVDRSNGIVAASGRVIAAGGSESVSRSRFSDELLHEVRALGRVKEALIGRFFAVDIEWFLATADRVDVIANDTYLSCKAARSGHRVTYVPQATCRYVAATTYSDSAAQRQRADAGYAQLRAMRVLQRKDEPALIDYMLAFLRTATRDPRGAAAWLRGMSYSARHRVYRPRSHAGTWETQSSTKRRLSP